MKEEKECPLFRRPESLSFGKGIGYCDMDGSSTNCDADTKFCGKPDALKQHLQRKVELSSHEERRQHPRFPVRLPLDFWETPDVVQAGLLTDMSEGGLGILSTHEIQIGAEVGVRVYLSRGEFSFDSIEGTGRIIWRTAHREQDWKGYRYGIYILKMASDSQDRLMKYIQILREDESSSH